MISEGYMKANTLEFYEEEAEIYDKVRFTSPVGKLADAIQKEIVLKLCDLDDKSLILDVGTGTGRFAIELAKKGAIVIGLDPSKSMIRLAKSKCIQAKVRENMNLVVADAHKLPFKNDSFDRSVSINVLNHIRDYSRVLEEIVRVLKQKGYVIANFPSIQSFCLPIAFFVNFRKRALFKNVYARWFTLGEINASLSRVGLRIQNVTGSLVLVSPPFWKKLSFFIVHIMEKVNILFSSSLLKYFSGNVFIKSQKTVEGK